MTVPQTPMVMCPNCAPSQYPPQYVSTDFFSPVQENAMSQLPATLIGNQSHSPITQQMSAMIQANLRMLDLPDTPRSKELVPTKREERSRQMKGKFVC